MGGKIWVQTHRMDAVQGQVVKSTPLIDAAMMKAGKKISK